MSTDRDHRIALWFGADGAGSAELPDDELACVTDGPVAHVILNRPARRNAMTARMWQSIAALAARLDADDAVRLIVFRGAGEQAFSAGADITEFREVYADAERTRRYNGDVRAAQGAVERLSKPVLAMIRGACVGGGCGLALCCDLRFASEDARFGIPPARLGTAYGPAETRTLLSLVGAGRAKDMLFSGRLLPAAEAYAIGLIDRVCPGGELEQQVADYARVLLANSGQSIRTAKRMVNALTGVDARLEQALHAEYEASFASADFREGYRAFVEKRRPRFG
ncbi:MAG: enoyl-CoA hydratase/isomerase family protein [Burkholderiales bacterium]|nr:MAG: enoyl-CoA hydratase/isomerase family protein [Burkholderiales bacterium]